MYALTFWPGFGEFWLAGGVCPAHPEVYKLAWVAA